MYHILAIKNMFNCLVFQLVLQHVGEQAQVFPVTLHYS